jgi:hypothetical protein
MTTRMIGTILTVIAVSPSTTVLADWWGWSGGCFPVQFDEVWVSATPDAGDVQPDVLVRVGQTVTLSGHARRITLAVNCSISATALPYKWSLTFRPPGGLAVPADSELQSPSTLSPRFNTKKGAYVITLVAGAHTAQLRVDATNGWVNIGPDTRTPPTPYQMGVGRVNGIAWDPVDSRIMYAATARGGIWRSDDAASTWWPMTDQKGLPATLSTSRVAVGPAHRVFVGTGDPDGGVDHQAIADGMFISDDGGVTWKHVDAALCPGTTDPPTGTITRIVIDPRSWQAPETVYVGASTGVFRSADGGNCWTNILPRAVWDIALVRSTSDIGPFVRPLWSLFAAVWPEVSLVTWRPFAIQNLVIQLENATDAGPSWNWRSLPAEPSATPQLTGGVSKIALAASNQSVYAAVAHPDDVAFFRYDVGGSWMRRPDPVGFSSQGGYDLALAVSPDDPNDVFVGLVGIARSTNGGQSWFDFNPGASIYSDQHTFVFDPSDSSRLFSGNDGGISSIELLPSNQAMQQAQAGPFWIPRNTGMMTSLFEALSVAHASTDRTGTAGGRQDAGTASRVNGRVWKLIGSGDGRVSGFDAVKVDVAYRNNNTVIEGHQWDFNRTTGGLTALAANFWTDPLRSGVILGVGVEGRSEFPLHYARDMDVASVPVWTCIDPTPGDGQDGVGAVDFLSSEGAYIAGTSRAAFFRLDVATNPPAVGICGNASAATVTPLWNGRPPPPPDPSATLAVGQTLGLSIDALSPDQFYATLARFDEWRVVRVFRDALGQWRGEPIAGLPGQPDSFPRDLRGCASCSGFLIMAPIAADPQAQGVVYVGTEGGLVVGTRSTDGRWSWSRDPDVPWGWVNDLRIRRGQSGAQGILRASTFGRSVWERSRFRPVTRVPPIQPPTPVWFFDPLREVVFRPWNALAVHYAYDGAAGPTALVRATLLVRGRPARGFVLEQATVEAGEGVVQLGILHAARDAAPSAITDAVRVQILTKEGRELFALEAPSPARWRRQDMRSLAVLTDAAGDDGPPMPIAARAEVSVGGRTLEVTNSAVVVPARARVTVHLPAVIETPEGAAHFAGWLEAPAGTPPRPVLTLTASEDMALAARYRLNISTQPPPRVRPTSLVEVMH